MEKLAPVALFAFNRADHLAATLNALALNHDAASTTVHIFIDGPRNEMDQASQVQIRTFLTSGIEKKFASLIVIQSEKNRGLAESIITGVTRIVNEFGRVIVLEDDLVTSPYFLQYMNNALDRYENDDRVVSIHGYLKPVENGNAPFFLKGADCWGWATWQRGWKLFEKDGSKLLAEIKNRGLEFEFTYENTYDYMGMLRNQIAGKNNSWAIRWYASAFLKNKLTLYPPKSLVKNIGFDGSGENCDQTSVFDVELLQAPITNFPDQVEVSQSGYRAYRDFYASIKLGLMQRIINKVKKTVLN